MVTSKGKNVTIAQGFHNHLSSPDLLSLLPVPLQTCPLQRQLPDVPSKISDDLHGRSSSAKRTTPARRLEERQEVELKEGLSEETSENDGYYNEYSWF